MRNVLALVALCAALVSVPAYAQKSTSKKTTAKAPTIKSGVDSISYSIGAAVGQNLKTMGLELNVDLIARALGDVLADKTLALTEDQMGAVMKALQERLAQQQMSHMQAQAGENKRMGEAFLAQNRTRQGVVTLPSGLQYEVITAGPGGPKPKLTDKVTTHYKGTLLDGSTFDSSYDRGEPASFQLDQVIRGWTEALQMMSVGDKWRLFVPSELAYGEGGAQGSPIGPNSTLVFEVELLQIN